MKSICIKTNNSNILNNLLKSLESININNTYITISDFKHYTNIILHYRSNNITSFCSSLSNILTKLIIEFYEPIIVKNNIILNYFYFDHFEQNKIFDNVLSLLYDKKSINCKYDLINNALFEHILNNHSIYLQGFVNFNLKQYVSYINEQIDIAVNKYLIDKEYIEFVNILRLYIKSESEKSSLQHLHLIYKDKTSIIIDDNHNIMSYNENIKNATYISDISFSSNDIALNTLLNMLPSKITIHLIDGYCDEFINTLKLIFQNKVHICEECNICNIYKQRQLKT